MDSHVHGDVCDEQRLICVMRIEFYFIVHGEYSRGLKLLHKVYSTWTISKFKTAYHSLLIILLHCLKITAQGVRRISENTNCLQ